MTWLTPYLSDALERWSDRGRFGWHAFPARNLRLETRLDAARAAEYLDVVEEPFDRDAWIAAHREYDLRHVAAVTSVPRRVLAKRDRAEWPAPFRSGVSTLALAPEMQLIHLTSVYSLSAGMVGTTAADILEAIRDRDEAFIEDVLESWWRNGSRTVYAGLADDLVSAVDDARSGGSSWANEIRDRLGLVHYDPLRDPIDVVLLAYRVKEVPRAEGLGTGRPIVAPTAVDSGLNAAFCPLATAGAAGRSVDLAGRLEAPVREVLHPRPYLRPSHVVASGSITTPVSDLTAARWAHLEWLRDEVGPPNYASDTDVDLVT